MKQFFIDKDIALEKVSEDITRKILAYSENLMVVKAFFAENGIGYDHTHEHEQVTYCVSGKFEYYLNGNTVELNPGDSVIVYSNQPHGLKCIKEGCLLDIFTPARKDFLGDK